MKIERIAKQRLIKLLKPGKVIVLLGSRRTGKTTILKEIANETNEKFFFWNGEDFAVHDLLKRRSIQNYKNLIGERKLILIDEAQKIPDIGNILKLIVDSFENLKIVVTGSSAFDIKNLTGEPLTGRKHDLYLYSISEEEINAYESPTQKFDNLMQRLVFGSMPEAINLTSTNEKIDYLRELVASYLMKDILIYENVKNTGKIFDLLKLIAFQVGQEVSLNELSRELGISKNTVDRYLDLLSKVFIVFKLRGFSGNLRKEVVNHSKWYFLDNGIRNAVINNFNIIEQRNDIGSLWENYMISERVKYQNYHGVHSNNYFWRTYDQQEIDWIEEREGKLFAYEFKWKEQRIKIPKAWQKNYPDSSFDLIYNQNYKDWIIPK